MRIFRAETSAKVVRTDLFNRSTNQPLFRYVYCFWSKSGTLKLGISDHDLVYIIRKQSLPRPKARLIESRSMQRFNDDDFQADLTAIPWDSAFVYDDIDDVWSHWYKLYKDTIDNTRLS